MYIIYAYKKLNNVKIIVNASVVNCCIFSAANVLEVEVESLKVMKLQ